MAHTDSKLNKIRQGFRPPGQGGPLTDPLSGMSVDGCVYILACTRFDALASTLPGLATCVSKKTSEENANAFLWHNKSRHASTMAGLAAQEVEKYWQSSDRQSKTHGNTARVKQTSSNIDLKDPDVSSDVSSQYKSSFCSWHTVHKRGRRVAVPDEVAQMTEATRQTAQKIKSRATKSNVNLTDLELL